MPLFEYRCAECGRLEEVLQKYNDPAPDACPACGKHGSMAREVSLTSFQLKGGGWYKDLYSSTSGAKPDAGSAPEKPAPKTDAPKTDTATTPTKPKADTAAKPAASAPAKSAA